ncbi:MAG TPA: hypothetical protein VGM08_03765 [Candidatus Saccharimonadales bacterium]|jgi:hypothetical protein
MTDTDAAAEHTGDTKRKFRTRWIVTGLLASGLIIGASLLLRYLNAPTAAASIANQPAHPSAPAVSGSRLVPVSDDYAQFAYPSFLTPLAQQQSGSGNVKAAYGFEYKASIPWQLTVTINYLPGGLANNDSTYYAMVQNPSRYQKITETVNGSPVAILSDLTAGGFSKIAFLFHGGYSADIALNGADQQDADREQVTFNGVIQSWRWQ